MYSTKNIDFLIQEIENIYIFMLKNNQKYLFFKDCVLFLHQNKTLMYKYDLLNLKDILKTNYLLNSDIEKIKKIELFIKKTKYYIEKYNNLEKSGNLINFLIYFENTYQDIIFYISKINLLITNYNLNYSDIKNHIELCEYNIYIIKIILESNYFKYKINNCNENCEANHYVLCKIKIYEILEECKPSLQIIKNKINDFIEKNIF